MNPSLQDSSTKRGKLKAKEKSPSPGGKPKMSPVADNPSARSPPPVRTPPKVSRNGSPLIKTPGKGGSVKKTVTFGINTAKGAPFLVKSYKSPEVGQVPFRFSCAMRPTYAQ